MKIAIANSATVNRSDASGAMACRIAAAKDKSEVELSSVASKLLFRSVSLAIAGSYRTVFKTVPKPGFFFKAGLLLFHFVENLNSPRRRRERQIKWQLRKSLISFGNHEN